jgi:MYXO-CTERM domain-containing protein
MHKRISFIMLGVLAGCEPAGPEATPGEPIETVRGAITGGQLATECQFPTTVLLNGCSGTLVNPLIVTTAGHCGTNHKTATFGETRTRPARQVKIEYCRTFSNASARDAGVTVGTTLRDWAYCKLAEPVNDVPIVPILMGCETDILKPGQKVVVAGFGETEANQGGFGTKRWVETTVNRVDSGRGIQVGGMGKAPCFGDSGGPAFVKLADGTWRVFGVDSSGLDSGCAAGDLMALIHKGVGWIEQTSGIDITPCHDADGTWHPSAACGHFPMAPDSDGRTWAQGCAEPVLSPPSMTCGAASGEMPPTSDAASAPADASRAPPARDAAAVVARDAAPPPLELPDAAMTVFHDAAAVVTPTPPDAAVVVPPRKAPPGGGCSCSLDRADRGTPPLLLLAALPLLLRRRRRQR